MNTAIESVDVPASTFAAEELQRAVEAAYRFRDYGGLVKLQAVRRYWGGRLEWYDQLLRNASREDVYRFACAVWRYRGEVIVVNVDNGRVLYAPEWMRV